MSGSRYANEKLSNHNEIVHESAINISVDSQTSLRAITNEFLPKQLELLFLLGLHNSYLNYTTFCLSYLNSKKIIFY